MKWPPFHPEARRELDDAIDFLERESPVLARRLVRRTMQVIQTLRSFHELGRPIGNECRRIHIRPFSYDLIYLPQGDDIVIVAFAHHRRTPGYWRDRS